VERRLDEEAEWGLGEEYGTFGWNLWKDTKAAIVTTVLDEVIAANVAFRGSVTYTMCRRTRSYSNREPGTFLLLVM